MPTPDDLMAACLAGVLDDPRERLELAQHLERDAEDAQRFREHVAMDVALRLQFSDDALRTQRLLANLRHLRERRTTSRRQLVVQGVRSRLPKRRAARQSPTPWLIAAALAVAVGAALVVGFWPQAATPQATWQVVAVRGTATIDGAPLSMKTSITKAARIRTDATGAVDLRHADGSRVDLAASGELALNPATSDGTLIEVVSGRLTVDLKTQPQDRPFIFRTDHGQVRVVGTAFTLDQHAQGCVVGMHSGSVQLRNPHGDLTLNAGQQGVLHNAHAPQLLRTPPADIVLRAADATITGAWQRLSDPAAGNGQALAVSAVSVDPVPLDTVTRSSATLHFIAEANVTYHVWIRGRSIGGTDNDLAHDAFALHAPTAERSAQTSAAFLRDTLGGWANDKAYFNGLACRPGYFWICGNYKPLGQPEGLDVQEPITVRFPRAGRQTLVLFPVETPIAIDTILLSPSPRDRPPPDHAPP